MFLTRLYKILKRIFGRAFFFVLSVVLQILWFVLFITVLGIRYPFFAGAVRALSLVIVLIILNRRVNPSYKLAWSLLILSMPLVGFAIYLMFGNSRIAKKNRKQFRTVELSCISASPEDPQDGPLAARWVDWFWNQPLRRGGRRYYDNCLAMFALLSLSGRYRIW